MLVPSIYPHEQKGLKFAGSNLNVSDLSFAAFQYQTHGHLTNTMVAVVFLRGWVVVDFFVNEDW